MEKKNIPLTSLLVNTENPRYEIVHNQIEAIRKMIEDQDEKLYNLAEDIVKNGLNPTDLIIVVPYEKESKKYIVLEGNRRIVSLKLLNNPHLIPDTNKKLYNKFLKLSEKFEINSITEILCVIFENEKEAYRWVKLKHTGENNGIGTVSWDAQQKARFDAKIEGKASYALQMLEFMKKQSKDKELIKELNNVPSSNLERLLSDPDVREIMGISIEQDKLVTALPPDEIIKPMTRIVRDLLRPDFKVKKIYYKEDRQKYLKEFGKDDIPDKTKYLKRKWEIQSNNPLQDEVQLTQPNPTKTKSLPLSTNRNTIIPKSCKLQIGQPRINQIYHELKKLDLRLFCNAAAILLRVFIELSIDYYIENKGINCVDKDKNLSTKLQAVATYY